MTDGQTDQSEQVADLAAPRSAGVEAAEVKRIHTLLKRSEQAARHSVDEINDNRRRKLFNVADDLRSAAEYVERALWNLEAAGAGAVGTEPADAG